MLLEKIGIFTRTFLNLLYPPYCLHCGDGIETESSLLCAVCSEQLDPLEQSDRDNHCKTKEQLFAGCASVFDYEGPASSIIKKMKYADMPFLSKGVAAYMVSQFIQLDWPLPEVIVPVPLSFTHQLQRGYNQSAEIAHEFGDFLKVPVESVLIRNKSGYSQAGLLRDQREKLSEETFSLRNGVDIANKRVMLIDDVYTTGSTLRCAAEALCHGFPFELYALTFCKS